MIAASEMVKRVRRLLNEAEEDARLSLLSEDTRSIDGHILALLPQAVAFVQKNKAPGTGCVNPRSIDAKDAAAVACGDGTGMLALPHDFAALVSLRLEGWERPCVHMYAAGSSEALAQHNVHTRAGACRPVCAECMSPNGSRALLLSPFPAGARLVHFVYEAQLDAAEGLAGSDGALADAVAYCCAALVYSVFERQDQANALLSLATLLCNGKSTERK